MHRERLARRTLIAVVLAGALLLACPAVRCGADTLFVSGTKKIVRVEIPSGAQTVIATGFGFMEDGACSPGRDGRVYFADWPELSRVTRWNQDGTGETPILPAAGTVHYPDGLSFDAAGNLYVNSVGGLATKPTEGAWMLPGGDPASTLIKVVPPYTLMPEGSDVVVGGPHEGALLLVGHHGPDGGVYISEPPGAPVRLLIPLAAFPAAVTFLGVATNGCGEIFVSHGEVGDRSGVLRFDPEGRFLEVYASGFFGRGFLDFDSDGNLYVTGSVSGATRDTVYRVAPDRTMSVFASIDGAFGVAMCRDRRMPSCVTCRAGGPYEAECAGPRTCVRLDGSATTGVGDGSLVHAWTSDCPGATFDDASSPTPTLCLDSTACRTACSATLTASVGSRVEVCAAPVTVRDSRPPVVPVSGDELACLWPPNHRYVCLSPADVAPPADDCSKPLAWRFAGCRSDEPDDAPDPAWPGWNGDGETRDDCVVSADGLSLCARAERAGTGPTAGVGRRYEVSMVATDACGNEAAAAALGRIWVPHDRSDRTRGCLDATRLGCRPHEPVPCAR